MLQTGSLIRNLTVRELITMLASLYPAPMAVDRVIELAGLEEVADHRTQKLSGGETQRVRFAVALASDPAAADPRRADGRDGRRGAPRFWTSMRTFAADGQTVIFATHYLEEADANADRVVLMAHGRDRRRRPDDRDQGPGRSPHRSARRSRRCPIDELATIPGVTDVDRRGDSVTLDLLDSDACAPRDCCSAIRSARDIEVTGARLEDAFLRAGRRHGRRAGGSGRVSWLAYTRYELLRTFRDRRLFLFAFGFPVILYFVIARPTGTSATSRRPASRRRSTTWSAWRRSAR